MLLYNVTVTVDLDVADEWLRWMRSEHIPEVLATGKFRSHRLSRLLGHEHKEAEIFTIQYLAENAAQFEQYQMEHAPALQRAHRERFDGKFAAFRTVMEVVELGE